MTVERGASDGTNAASEGTFAMAGRNSPWGGGGSGGSGDGSGDGPSEPGHDGDETPGSDRPQGASGSAPDAPPENKGSPDGEKRGPRNPWLPTGDPVPPRRSASIEDIFRSRDPRRPSGGGGGPGLGGFPNLPRRPDGKSWVPLGIGVAVVLALGFASVHVLGPKEQGLVTTLGRYSRTIDSGTSLTLPWPIEQVRTVDVHTVSVDMIPDDDKEKLMLTSDKSLVDLSYLVRWNIKNLKDYSFNLVDAHDTVRQVAEAAMRASMAQVTLDEALSGEGRAHLETDVRDRMQRILDYYHAGIAIQGVDVRKADPPAKTKAAFDQVNVAQQEAERDRSEARAWAQQLLARSQGDAASFDKVYEQYKLAPEVTKRRMYYETMERLLRDNDTVVADAPGVTSYLPLPEVKRHPAPQPDATVTSAQSAGGQ